MSIEKLKRKYPLKLQWIHFPLHPETPMEGRSLEDLFNSRDLNAMRERFRQLFAEAGLPYGTRSMTYNSRLAQELGAWADTQLDGEAIHDALYRAYFAEGINIANVDALVTIAESIGLDGKEARKVVEQRLFRAQVDKDWQFSRDCGITGVPTFLAKNTLLVGCQPYEVLEQFAQNCIEKQSGK
ncbi:hypothetical protein NBRC116493_22240 [Aurantivibrio infirmus]